MNSAFLQPDQQLHHYRILEVLPPGPSYHLYRAQHIHTKIVVLLKSPRYNHESLQRSGQAAQQVQKLRQELAQEARLLALLSDYDASMVPLLLEVFSAPPLNPVLRQLGLALPEQELFLAREYLPGEPLHRLVARQELPLTASLRIVRKLGLFLAGLQQRSYGYPELSYDHVLVTQELDHISVCHYRTLQRIAPARHQHVKWLGHCLGYLLCGKRAADWESMRPLLQQRQIAPDVCYLIAQLLNATDQSPLQAAIEQIERILGYPAVVLDNHQTSLPQPRSLFGWGRRRAKFYDPQSQRTFVFWGPWAQGARGRVDQVRDVQLGTVLLAKRPLADSSLQSQLQRELQRAYRGMVLFSRLTPHCPQPVSLIPPDAPEGPCMLVKKINGCSLAELLHQSAHQQLPEQWILETGRKIALFLKTLHHCGLDHGVPCTGADGAFLFQDLKPENIVLGPHWENLFLVDFGGLAYRHPEQGIAPAEAGIGTPGYLAPEAPVCGSCQIDERADIYAWGAVMFALSTRICPAQLAQEQLQKLEDLRQQGRLASYQARDYEYPVLPLSALEHTSQALRRIITRALARDPAQRYPDVASLLVALHTSLSLPPPAPGPSSFELQTTAPAPSLHWQPAEIMDYRLVIVARETGTALHWQDGQQIYLGDGHEGELRMPPESPFLTYTAFLLGQQGPWHCSVPVTVQLPAASEVRHLELVPGPDHILLRWQFPAQATEICVVRWHGTQMSRSWVEQLTEYMDYEVTPGEHYQYTVYLKKADGSLSQGVSISGSALPPLPAPAFLQVVRHEDHNEITAPQRPAGCEQVLLERAILFAHDKTGPWEKIYHGPEVHYQDRSCDPCQDYLYRLSYQRGPHFSSFCQAAARRLPPPSPEILEYDRSPGQLGIRLKPCAQVTLKIYLASQQPVLPRQAKPLPYRCCGQMIWLDNLLPGQHYHLAFFYYRQGLFSTRPTLLKITGAAPAVEHFQARAQIKGALLTWRLPPLSTPPTAGEIIVRAGEHLRKYHLNYQQLQEGSKLIESLQPGILFRFQMRLCFRQEKSPWQNDAAIPLHQNSKNLR